MTIRYVHPLPELARPRWQERAACRGDGITLYFPETGARGPIKCEACSVRVECLDYALSHHIAHGTWGGVSERGRRRMLKARRNGRAS